MAFKTTIISPLSSLTLVPAITEGDDIVGDDIFLGHDTLTNRLPYNQNDMRVKHWQKVAIADPVVLQFHTTAAVADVTAFITQCDGTDIFELDLSYAVEEIYSTYDNDGDTVRLNTLQYNFRFGDYFDATDEGTYRVEINIDYDGITTASFRSEIVNLKVEHPDTELLYYACELNRLDTLFEQFSTGFARRFNFKIGQIQPEREESDFISQPQKMVKVTSYPYNMYEFEFKDVTDYDMQALNYIFACDKFRINTQVFITNENIDFEQTGQTPFYQATITVRDAELNQNFSYQAADTIVLFDSLGAYPFNVFFNVMDDGFSRIAVVPDPIVFESVGDIDTFVDELNNVLKPQQGLTGTFSRVDDSVRYTNGFNEKYVPVGAENVLTTRRVVCTVEIFSAVQTFQLQQREFYSCIDWGDGSPLVAINYALNSTNYVNSSHAYATTGTYTLTFWWANNNVAGVPLQGTGLKFQPITPPNGGANGPLLTNIVCDNFAERLREFSVFYADFTGVTINTTWLKESYNYLELFNIIACNMDSFLFTSFNLVAGRKWNVLRSINMGTNKLTQSNVNAILVALNNNLKYPVPAKTIYTKGQTPPATPSGNGLLAKNNMVGAGWNVQTD